MPNVKMISIHRREVGGYADACWLQFACDNPTDPAVVNVMQHDPHLRAVVHAHIAKQSAPPGVDKASGAKSGACNPAKAQASTTTTGSC
jgi:hypothetical protein